MADFNTNIRRIRSEAIYGKDVREAIAEGLTQADANVISAINSKVASIVDDFNSIVTPLETRATNLEDFAENMSDTFDTKINNRAAQVEGRITQLEDRVTVVKNQIDNEEIYVNLMAMGDDSYLMVISS